MMEIMNRHFLKELLSKIDFSENTYAANTNQKLIQRVLNCHKS